MIFVNFNSEGQYAHKSAMINSAQHLCPEELGLCPEIFLFRFVLERACLSI